MRPPKRQTIERWARDLIVADRLEDKLAPPPLPTAWEPDPAPRDLRPGRPPELVPIGRPPKTPRPGALRDPRRRAQLLHTFFHHELQAAELMAWALLRFVEAPREFRRGLARIARDEIRHANLYADHLRRLGYPVGSFGVRDWFWQRVGAAAHPADFVALLGIGFEGANLDHAARFAELFEAAGDPEAAAIQRRIGEEEVPHVRFAIRWFETWVGPLELAAWMDRLPPPLTPIVMRGRPLSRAPRRRAGMPERFLDALEAYPS